MKEPFKLASYCANCDHCGLERCLNNESVDPQYIRNWLIPKHTVYYICNSRLLNDKLCGDIPMTTPATGSYPAVNLFCIEENARICKLLGYKSEVGYS